MSQTNEVRVGNPPPSQHDEEAILRRVTFRVMLDLLATIKPNSSADSLVFDLMSRFENTYRNMYPQATAEDLTSIKGRVWSYYDAARNSLVVEPLDKIKIDDKLPKGIGGIHFNRAALKKLQEGKAKSRKKPL